MVDKYYETLHLDNGKNIPESEMQNDLENCSLYNPTVFLGLNVDGDLFFFSQIRQGPAMSWLRWL